MSQMIEVKTADLIGPALDWAVAVAEGHKPNIRLGYTLYVEVLIWNQPGAMVHELNFAPSINWAQAGPLIEKYGIGLLSPKQSPCCCWHASVIHPDFTDYAHPASPLIAACRAIVAAKLGDTVSVRADLVTTMEGGQT